MEVYGEILQAGQLVSEHSHGIEHMSMCACENADQLSQLLPLLATKIK